MYSGTREGGGGVILMYVVCSVHYDEYCVVQACQVKSCLVECCVHVHHQINLSARRGSPAPQVPTMYTMRNPRRTSSWLQNPLHPSCGILAMICSRIVRGGGGRHHHITNSCIAQGSVNIYLLLKSVCTEYLSRCSSCPGFSEL